MAASPQWKVYRDKEYVASCKYVEDAAAIVACSGEGATIRNGHREADIVWREGAEAIVAGESYDVVTETVQARVGKRKHGGAGR